MKNALSLFLLFLSFISVDLHGQNLRQGAWRDHLSYFACEQVVEVNDWIYASTGSGLISFNKTSQVIRKHSKATGLSDVLISAIAYAEDNDYLIIGYKNGNIDLIREGESPLNITDIKRKIMTADKRINQILVNGTTAYLSCGFGIVVLNLDKLEIKETYILGESGAFVQVNDVAILNNHLFAATVAGIYSVDLNSPNLLDFNYWTHLDFLPDPLDSYSILEEHNNKIFTVHSQGDSIFQILELVNEATDYEEWDGKDYTDLFDINSTHGFLTISSSDQADIYNQNDLLIDQFNFYGIRQILISRENEVFFASNYGGLIWHASAEKNMYLLVDGPRFSEASQVATLGEKVWVSSGGPNNPYKHGAIHYIDEGHWESFSTNQIHTTNKTLGNTYKIAIDPLDPEHIFVGTYGYGIIEIRNNEIVKIYELYNTEMFSGISEIINIRVTGLDFDSDGNLYFILDLVSNPLFMIDQEGNLHRPEINNSLLPKLDIFYSDLLVTERGQIWILSAQDGAVILEEEDGYFDSKTILIKNQYGNVLNKTYCIEEDKEGNIWIGTNNGPIIYYSPWNIFGYSETNGFQVPIPRNDGTNIVDPLLFSETIFDIVSDGGNRKWLATASSGVFLVSDDGKKTLQNFTKDNSPLLSNGVTGIGVQELSGEVFFATDLGLISYGGSAIEGLEEYTDVYAYPNPVRPGYEGPITITGLVSNSIVKITDVSGNLVWETTSLGGQAIWDGRNFEGNRVATGVYLVMLATEDGSKSHITKILFLH